MKRSRARRGLIADTRGASLVEYILVVGAVAIVSIGGYRAFGSSVQAKAEAQARCVETFDCGGSAAPAPGTGTAAAGVDGQSWNPFASVQAGNPNPAFGNIPGGRNATYQTIPGVPTVQGPGDATAVHPNDVSQGQIGDCYLISSMAAIANRNPELIQNAVVANSDGSYTVTFQERAAWYNPFDSGYHPVQIRVTGDFPAVNGNPVFAQPGDGAGAGRELWPMIVEKAYAQWQGGYDSIGRGGTAGGPMSALTGRDSVQYGGRNWQNWVGWGVEMDTVATAWERGDAITTGTGTGSGTLFTNGTLVQNHEYWVTNVDRQAGTVTVRNPWGWGRGEITMSFEDYRSHFIGMTTNPAR